MSSIWLDASEDQPHEREVIVLGLDLEQRAFADDPAILGRKIYSLQSRSP